MNYISFLMEIELRENETIKEIRTDDERHRRKYFISNYGDKVFSLCQNKITLLSILKDTKGYCYTTIQYNGKRYKPRIHKLVAEAFIFNPYKGQKDIIIHHKDKNKLNNKMNNLVFMTKKEHDKLHSMQGECSNVSAELEANNS